MSGRNQKIEAARRKLFSLEVASDRLKEEAAVDELIAAVYADAASLASPGAWTEATATRDAVAAALRMEAGNEPGEFYVPAEPQPAGPFECDTAVEVAEAYMEVSDLLDALTRKEIDRLTALASAPVASRGVVVAEGHYRHGWAQVEDGDSVGIARFPLRNNKDEALRALDGQRVRVVIEPVEGGERG